MNIKFDHLSLSAKNPEKMRDFLIALLDLKVGSRANLSFDGYFLFAGDKDVIHIFGQPQDVRHNFYEQTVQNIVHHISFFSDSYEDVMARITALDLGYSINQVPGALTIKIFVRGPENLIIEIQTEPPTS
jgi:catechol 2,3-dioxygenase-like lactoylglutathione lyase family enzyme